MDNYENKEKKHFKDINTLRINERKIKISWTLEDPAGEIKIYWNNTAKIDGNERHLITVSGENSVVFDDPDMKRRNYFILKGEGYVPQIVAEVLLPLKGANNFRDLGGYKSSDGRSVKWNVFYRSDKLGELTKEDMEYLKSLGIKTIFDYRSQEEAERSPDPFIEGIENINISAMPALDGNDGNLDMFSLVKESNSLKKLGNPHEFLKKGYIEMVFNNEAFRTLMHYIQQLDKVPIVQHCTAGKDRTGIGSALILLALGVPEETVIEDYLITNVYRSKINDKLMKLITPMLNDEESILILKSVIEVRKEYIEIFLSEAKKKYKSIENYFAEQYGLDKEKIRTLREHYLE